MIWLLVALAASPDPARVQEERLVAEAAAAVASARRDGARPARIADLMSTYRREAEKLAAMQGSPDLAEEARAHASALRALGDATAAGVADGEARAVVEGWLGPLETRLGVLETALQAARPELPELAGPIAADVIEQAVAVHLAATYDASRQDAAAREARTRAAALRASLNPLERPALSVDIQIHDLDSAAELAEARAVSLRALADRAAALRDRAATMWGG